MRVRPMLRDDIPGGMKLVEAAGWNQTEADWKRFLDANAPGCFVAEADGEVCGTAASIIYESRVAWIGMVLVSPAYRGRGIATRLLETVLERLQLLRIPAIKLDATPQGMSLYRSLGFAPEYEIERWKLTARNSLGEFKGSQPQEVHLSLDEIIKTDRAIFGADRGALLRSLHRDAPTFTAAVTVGDALAGYTLGRRGLHAGHLGPWMARDEGIAAHLLRRFLAQSARATVIVDVLKSNAAAGNLLRSLNFEVSRPLTRMAYGATPSASKPEHLYAILGPEFG